MAEVAAELKALRLYGMAAAWADLTAQGSVGIDASRWLIEHLLQAEHTDRAMRSVSDQLKSARFPVHRDLAGFDFSQAKVDEHLIRELADLSFTEAAHNVVFIGGTGTGKTHLATARAVRHYPARAAGALLLHRGPGQSPGAGEGTGARRQTGLEPDAGRSGHPR
jgi:DNA replication protein DnaC